MNNPDNDPKLLSYPATRIHGPHLQDHTDHPVDLQFLLKSTRGNRGFATRLVVKFCSNAQATLKDVCQAIGEGDLNQAGKLAHALKGASLVIGAGHLARVANKLVNNCRSGDPIAAENTIEDLETAWSTTMDFLDQSVVGG